MRTKFYQRSALCAFSILFGAVFSKAIALEADSIAKTPQNQYPQDYVAQYMKNCTQISIGEGLEEPEAKTLCTCTINRFQARYTIEEFKALTEASQEDAEAADALNEIGQDCFEEILYE